VSAVGERAADLVRRVSGFRVPPERHGWLLAALDRASGGADRGAFLDLAARSDAAGAAALERLLDEVTVKETTLLRHRSELEAIDWPGLAAAARAGGSRVVRVWSAGCATGEEVYSLAMLAAEAFSSPDPPVRVLGTDVSGAALDGARRGCYRGRSLDAVEEWRRSRHFLPDGDALTVRPGLGALVEFRRHNLVADPIPPPGEDPFDLIVCRNVLIYFEVPEVKRVAERLSAAVRPGGRLVLGAADGLALAAQGMHRPVRRTPAARRARERAVAAPAAPDARLSHEGHLARGIAALDRAQPESAVPALRAALYLEPDHGLAAFALGRAHDALGRRREAARAYERALDALERGAGPSLEEVAAEDVAAACRARLAVLHGVAR